MDVWRPLCDPDIFLSTENLTSRFITNSFRERQPKTIVLKQAAQTRYWLLVVAWMCNPERLVTMAHWPRAAEKPKILSRFK